MRWISLLLLLPSVTLAIPEAIHQEGFLTDAQGIPHEGPTQLRLSLYGQAEGGAALWFEEHNLDIIGGYYSVILGTQTPFEAAWEADPRFLGVTVNGAELLPRVQLSSVPYALSAENVVGDITPHSVYVGGQQIIDEGGNWVGPAVPGANDGVGYDTPEEALAAVKSVDGAGSGLDADTLDGFSSAAFLQNSEQVMALLLAADGAGSGLDADLLDGHDSSVFIRTAAQLIELLLTTDGIGSALDADRLDGHDSNAFIRNTDPAVATQLLSLLLTVDGEGSGLDADLLDGHNGDTFLKAADPATAAEVLNLLLTVDGAGSNLDADLLDGLQGSRFMRVDQNTGTSGNLSIGGVLSGVDAQFPGTIVANRVEADEIHAEVISLIPLNVSPDNPVEGTIYNHSSAGLKIYNGTIWKSVVSGVTGKSCKAILDAGDSLGDGVYSIDPDGIGGEPAFDSYCDMTTDDGGWTLVYKIADGSNMKTTSAIDIQNLSTRDISLSTSGKFSDLDIKEIYTEQFRIEQHSSNPSPFYCKFDDINNYDDGVANSKRCSQTYSADAVYDSSSGASWAYGFSSWYTTGSIILQLNYGDARLGSHLVYGGSSSDGGCSSGGGCHAQVWVR